ncbi:MAG TPA: hypothetical protein DCS93_30660 [Microscillaceae bacterium]|nr:hypothetical protein [Microscillaceae bacterium]
MSVKITGYLTILFIFLLGLECYSQIKLTTPRTRRTNFDVANAILNVTVKDAEENNKTLRPNLQILDSANNVVNGYPGRFRTDQEALNLPIYQKYNIKLSLQDYDDTTLVYDLTGQKIAYQASRVIYMRPKRTRFGLKIQDIESNNDVPVNIVLKNKNRDEQITLSSKDRKNSVYNARIRQKDDYDLEIKDNNGLSIYKGKVNANNGTYFVIAAQKVQGYNIYTVQQYKDANQLGQAIQTASRRVKNFSLNVKDLESDEGIQAGAVFTNKNRNEQIIIQPTDGSGRTIQVSLREGDEYNMEVNASKNYFFHSDKVKITNNSQPKAVSVKLTKLEKGAKLALKDIYFDFNSAELRDSSFIELERVVKMLKANPKVKLSIEAHTDNVGSRGKNLRLSDRRAQSVAVYLKEQKINDTRLVTKGFGEDRPIVPNTSEENKAKNRRVELRVLESSK